MWGFQWMDGVVGKTIRHDLPGGHGPLKEGIVAQVPNTHQAKTTWTSDIHLSYLPTQIAPGELFEF